VKPATALDVPLARVRERVVRVASLESLTTLMVYSPLVSPSSAVMFTWIATVVAGEIAIPESTKLPPVVAAPFEKVARVSWRGEAVRSIAEHTSQATEMENVGEGPTLAVKEGKEEKRRVVGGRREEEGVMREEEKVVSDETFRNNKL